MRPVGMGGGDQVGVLGCLWCGWFGRRGMAFLPWVDAWLALFLVFCGLLVFLLLAAGGVCAGVVLGEGGMGLL